MMTDTDIQITCKKFRNDPFFKKLKYIQNKITANDEQIKINYPLK